MSDKKNSENTSLPAGDLVKKSFNDGIAEAYAAASRPATQTPQSDQSSGSDSSNKKRG